MFYSGQVRKGSLDDELLSEYVKGWKGVGQQIREVGALQSEESHIEQHIEPW